MLPGLENYLSGEYSGYASVVVSSRYPHPCTSFDYPARCAVSVGGVPTKSLLFIVMRGKGRIEDISWKVSMNEVKISRVFKPQHILKSQEGYYYVYVADISPILKDTAIAELMLKCHAHDTHVETSGLVLLLSEEFQSRVSVYLGVSRVNGEQVLWGPGEGFSVMSIVGRGRGGSIVVNGVVRELNGLFEVSELLQDSHVHVRGPIDVYAIVTTTLPGKPAEVQISSVELDSGKLKLGLTNPGDYSASNISIRLLRGASIVNTLTISRIKPGESFKVTLDQPPAGTTVKITYEFCGYTFSRLLQLSSL